MRKNLIKSTLVVAFLTVAGLGGMKMYGNHLANKNDFLLLQNIEALCEEETSTSWNCNSKTTEHCHAYCGTCHTEVEGTGALTGDHSCSKK